MNTYKSRVVDEEITALASSLAALAIEGIKGVGKTATAKRRAETTLELDLPETVSVLESDPTAVLRMKKPVLIDEWQRFPQSWDIVRRAVDQDQHPNQFFLTGSANPLNPPTHSGAGRITTVRMRPLSLWERQLETPTVSLRDLLAEKPTKIEGTTNIRLPDYVQELISPGLPGLRHLSGRALRSQMGAYVQRIVDRDINELGMQIRQPNQLLRWIRSYAAATSTTSSYETIRDAATPGESQSPSKATCQTYREILERLWILDPVPAWLPTKSSFKQLTAGPKHHLADPALATHLLGVDFEAMLRGDVNSSQRWKLWGTLLGRLFESLATLSVRIYAQNAEAETMHFRTQGGRNEVDLIVVRPDQRVVGIEIKLSSQPDDSDTKNLLWLKDKLGDDVLDLVIINCGSYAYRRKDGVAVIPAVLLGP